jgi:hypothetical protein
MNLYITSCQDRHSHYPIYKMSAHQEKQQFSMEINLTSEKDISTNESKLTNFPNIILGTSVVNENQYKTMGFNVTIKNIPLEFLRTVEKDNVQVCLVSCDNEGRILLNYKIFDFKQGYKSCFIKILPQTVLTQSVIDAKGINHRADGLKDNVSNLTRRIHYLKVFLGGYVCSSSVVVLSKNAFTKQCKDFMSIPEKQNKLIEFLRNTIFENSRPSQMVLLNGFGNNQNPVYNDNNSSLKRKFVEQEAPNKRIKTAEIPQGEQPYPLNLPASSYPTFHVDTEDALGVVPFSFDDVSWFNHQFSKDV